MAEEAQAQAHETRKRSKRRSLGHKKDGKAKKKLKVFQGTEGKPRIDNKMRKLFRKRARDYNSDDEDESVPSAISTVENKQQFDKEDVLESQFSDEEGDDSQDAGEEDEISEDEDGEIQPGITKFTQGCNAFRMAFKKITKKGASEDSLGPVLSAHKKLVAEKLAEEVEDHKAKGEAKKEKHLVGEKGHVKPANFLDSHEKFLVGVATKGVVKLFNAVNKAQSAQKGLNPSRSKDAKALRKQRKEVFFSELGRTSSELAEAPAKVRRSTGPEDGEGPSWAPLRDNYMLTSSKLKDWDKMPDTAVVDDVGGMPSDDSSDDD